jgi:hypothetical protein
VVIGPLENGVSGSPAARRGPRMRSVHNRHRRRAEGVWRAVAKAIRARPSSPVREPASSAIMSACAWGTSFHLRPPGSGPQRSCSPGSPVRIRLVLATTASSCCATRVAGLYPGDAGSARPGQGKSSSPTAPGPGALTKEGLLTSDGDRPTRASRPRTQSSPGSAQRDGGCRCLSSSGDEVKGIMFLDSRERIAAFTQDLGVLSGHRAQAGRWHWRTASTPGRWSTRRPAGAAGRASSRLRWWSRAARQHRALEGGALTEDHPR